MKKIKQKNFYFAVCLLAMFVLWTIAISFIDVKAIGPHNSTVGFAALNGFVHDLTGVNMSLYIITDWLGLVPLGVVMGFALLGLVQWIKRKNLLKVDNSILVLGGFYITVLTVYVFFEIIIINYRPVLINGVMETSYPSSTTMLVMCVMPTAVMQFNARIKNCVIKRCIAFLITSFIVFMIVVRLISGVHWFTDIIGGALLSAGLVMMYSCISGLDEK